MLLMDSARHAGYSPVSLDLNVGLPSMPPPRRDMETEADTQPDRPVGGRAAAPMTDEEANKTLLEAKLTEASEENRRLHEMIAYLHANTASPGLPSPAAGCKKRIRLESPDPSNSCDGGNGDRNDPESARLGVIDEASCKRIKVIRVCTRINPVDTALAVKDGYQWRKYGQKVTRDNPSPRAYFRCAFAPSCPVKKKVQRSAEDSSVLVATYEGEHNHPSPMSAGELRSCATRSGSVPCSISIGSAGPTITLDLTKNGARALDADEAPEPTELKKLCKEIASPEFRTALVERMASALTSDSNFTGAIAAAILRQLPEY